MDDSELPWICARHYPKTPENSADINSAFCRHCEAKGTTVDGIRHEEKCPIFVELEKRRLMNLASAVRYLCQASDKIHKSLHGPLLRLIDSVVENPRQKMNNVVASLELLANSVGSGAYDCSAEIRKAIEVLSG